VQTQQRHPRYWITVLGLVLYAVIITVIVAHPRTTADAAALCVTAAHRVEALDTAADPLRGVVTVKPAPSRRRR
jgi:hypothetical protein